MLLRQPWLLLAGSLILLAVLRGTTCCSLARVREPFAIAWSYDTSGYLETCGCSARQLGGVAKRATMLSDLRSKQPVLAIEGAHIVEDRGLIFLFNPNPTPLSGRFRLDGERLGITKRNRFEVVQTYPASGVTQPVNLGQEVVWEVPAQTGIVLSIAPV